MRNPVVLAASIALATALGAQEAQESARARPIPALEIAQQRVFLETALMGAAPEGWLKPGDFNIDIEGGPDTEGESRMIAKISFRGGRNAPKLPRAFSSAAVRGVEADAERGWRIIALDVRFEGRDAESDTPAAVRSLVFVRGDGAAAQGDGARALTAVDSAASAAELTDVRFRPTRLQLTGIVRDQQRLRLLRLEFEMVGEGFRSGFAAIAAAFEAAVQDGDSSFVAVRSRGRERVLSKATGATYELEIELKPAGVERGR